ncbi:MAG: ATP-binding protein [Chthoniobacteraceae bacterium]
MSLVTRLTWWFAALLGLALLIVPAVTYYELLVENNPKREALWIQFTEVAVLSAIPLLVLAAGGWWLGVRALRPLRELTLAASRIHASNLDERIPLRGTGDELDQLAAVFNDMTTRLGASFDRVREFTLHASHELKTPLAILRADFDHLLDEPGRSEADRARFASHLDEIERLARIVDGLTLLTKADAQLVTIERADVRLDDIVRDAAEDARALGESRRLRVVCKAAPVTIRGDRHRLRQLLLILADNAVKYNHDDGEIAFTLAADAVLRVRNTGPAIPPSEQPHIFQRFFRGAATAAADIEGSGLGLPIAQWIAHAHGGTLAFTSGSDCTEFILTLPAE